MYFFFFKEHLGIRMLINSYEYYAMKKKKKKSQY